MNVYDMEQHLWYASALIGSDSLEAAAQELASCEQLNEQIKDPYTSLNTDRYIRPVWP